MPDFYDSQVCSDCDLILGAEGSLPMCLYDPDSCVQGFTVSLWYKQTQEQRTSTPR